ncbi:hypothetical protein [Campylobacter lanienae]|nr:hypothetical protein [Campylobacter lanienae]MDY6134441.1 hypothetical protein [Campylobacter lanienae]
MLLCFVASANDSYLSFAFYATHLAMTALHRRKQINGNPTQVETLSKA